VHFNDSGVGFLEGIGQFGDKMHLLMAKTDHKIEPTYIGQSWATPCGGFHYLEDDNVDFRREEAEEGGVSAQWNGYAQGRDLNLKWSRKEGETILSWLPTIKTGSRDLERRPPFYWMDMTGLLPRCIIVFYVTPHPGGIRAHDP
jgi:hypothetical protein